jgi:hypothetical protein
MEMEPLEGKRNALLRLPQYFMKAMLGQELAVAVLVLEAGIFRRLPSHRFQ